MAKLTVDVWSDIACPWCYVGKRRFERALAEFVHAADVRVVWQAFELDPAAPKERDPSVPHAARIARKYGISVAQAEQSTARLVQTGKEEGIAFDFEHIRSGSMFDAHRVVHLGRERDVQGAVKERMLRAYFEEGALMSDPSTLLRLGVEAGLDATEVADVLASDAHARAVRSDEAKAAELGISGVPVFRSSCSVVGMLFRARSRCTCSGARSSKRGPSAGTRRRASTKAPRAGRTAADSPKRSPVCPPLSAKTAVVTTRIAVRATCARVTGPTTGAPCASPGVRRTPSVVWGIFV